MPLVTRLDPVGRARVQAREVNDVEEHRSSGMEKGKDRRGRGHISNLPSLLPNSYVPETFIVTVAGTT